MIDIKIILTFIKNIFTYFCSKLIDMKENTIYKTSDFVSFLEGGGVVVTVEKNPDVSVVERIKKMIAKKKALFEFQKSLFN